MKQDDFDIPEVFRRAMEEAGWRADRDDDGGDRPPRRPFSPSARPPRFNRTLLFAFLALLLLFSLGRVASFYTDFLWFSHLGYRDMFVKRQVVALAVFAVAFVVALAILLPNWLAAARRAAATGGPPVVGQSFLSGGGRWVITGVAVFLALLMAGAAGGRWEDVLLYLNAQPFGVQAPLFGRDLSFYVFYLPVYRFVQGWLAAALFITLLGLILIYAAPNLSTLQRGAWRPLASPGVRRHLAVLGGFLLLVWAVGYALDIFGLLYSTRGVAFGAGYTDMTAVLWALRLQIVFVSLTALALFYNAFRPAPRLPLLAGALWLVCAVFVGGVLPGVLQRYVVEPNELTLETPYIENNIALTRLAFDLERIEAREFGQVEELRPQDLLDNEDVLRNLRLWDWRPLQKTYLQLQGLRPYYDFNDVDVDRYNIDGVQRQVMLGARELNKDELPAPSWVNRNLEFTHGYGIVMNPVNEATPDGRPSFFIKDFPPQSSVEDIQVTRPEIYYGELTGDTVYVGSGRQEFSYPSGDENVYTNYAGTGGVVLDSFLKRLAFALRQSDPNVLLNDDITNATRAQYRRQIQQRVHALTPFLLLDHDPYLVVNNEGRLIWLQDAYTYSNALPYSTPIDFQSRPSIVGRDEEFFGGGTTLNYIRNAVKVAVDAYNGSVTYYVADDTDPIISSYARAFPGVFRPLDEMPADLLAHVRYPEDLFNIQARQYATYHMTDVRVFYNKEDLWQIPSEIADSEEKPVEPYYVSLPLPGETEPEYLLILPFNPFTRNNMIAWMAARNDPQDYGRLIVYELPKQELVFGPIQIEGRINQEPTISEQFTLWDQRGSNVTRGNLLVLPINRSFLYIEPVYLSAETSALPELKRIVTASNSAVAMAPTLNESLRALAAGGGATTGAETAPPATGPDLAPLPPAAGDATVAELVAAANAHLQAAEAAQRRGDWALYGQELDALRQTLARLDALAGQSE